MSQFTPDGGPRGAAAKSPEQQTNRTASIGGRWGRSTVSATVYGLRNGLFDSPEATEQ
jgi:hypothetical protein